MAESKRTFQSAKMDKNIDDRILPAGTYRARCRLPSTRVFRQRQRAAQGFRQALQQKVDGHQRYQALEQEYSGNAARLRGALANQPGLGHVAPAADANKDTQWHQENDAANRVDPGPAAGTETAIENVDPDVSSGFQSVGRAQHEQGAVHVSHSFLCHDGAGVEAVAHDDDQSSNQCHGQCEPRQASTT